MSVPADFLAFLEKIPASLWGVIGVIVGSFAAGVTALVIFFLGDRGHDRRLRMQLNHDRDLKEA